MEFLLVALLMSIFHLLSFCKSLHSKLLTSNTSSNNATLIITSFKENKYCDDVHAPHNWPRSLVEHGGHRESPSQRQPAFPLVK